VVLIRSGIIRSVRLPCPATIALWMVCTYFAFNVIGNATSPSTTERLVFTPISIAIAMLALRLALSKGSHFCPGRG